MKANPVAVLISDIHYTIQTLAVADAALKLALNKACALDVPLIVAGDLHDTKANMRAECVKAMLNTFAYLDGTCYILRGNHDSVNEKSKEHSLEFLRELHYVRIVDDAPVSFGLNITLIPYHHDVNELKERLKTIPKGSTVIMHQGLQSSNPGDYIQDKSAIAPEDVTGLRVISGHYHTRQTIDLPDGGEWSYIGNPYTLNFAEANDPEKGFQILMSDGSLEFVPTNLREHIVIDVRWDQELFQQTPMRPGDFVKVKVRGDAIELATLSKHDVRTQLMIPIDFQLDLIPDETEATATEEQVSQLSQADLLDSMIESIDADANQKNRLKTLWKDLK